jgi:UDPglucose--hexose-1-phosphate uridylyltransferase
MSELRYNIIAKDWVVISTERAKRPDSFKKPKDEKPVPEHSKDCPFCPGNEGDRHDQTYCLGDKNAWKVRAIRNKYPAFSLDQKEERKISGMYNYITGYGMHEVIVEHPLHNRIIPLMNVEEVGDILKTYKERYVSMAGTAGIEAVTIFKNHGPAAGCSQQHPHSQIAGTPVVPHQIRLRMEASSAFFDMTGKCVYCHMIENEFKAKERIICESEKFAAFCPFASQAPFIIWILPKRHSASFDDIDAAETADLAGILRVVLRKLYLGLGNPDFNLTIRSVPVKEKAVEYFHWGISVVPRLTQPAGFELGSGMFINTTMPEECAKFLRETKI